MKRQHSFTVLCGWILLFNTYPVASALHRLSSWLLLNNAVHFHLWNPEYIGHFLLYRKSSCKSCCVFDSFWQCLLFLMGCEGQCV